MIMLDSSALIELVEGSEKGLNVKKVVEQDSAVISSISVNEVLITSQGKERELFEKILKSLQILPFDAAASYKSIEIEKQLIKNGTMIEKLDIFIASICLVHQISIITLDKDYTKIKELNVVLI